MNHKRFSANLELKNMDENGSFEGYASVFGVEDSDGDVINKGAFKGSIDKYTKKGKMPKMLWQHNPSIIVGKFTDIIEDENGLYVKGKLILDVEKGKEAYFLMKEGALDAMSVGFNIESASTLKNGGRSIDDLDLWEISLVTWGANPDALVSSVKGIKTERDFEQYLRDSGFSKNEAVAICSKGFKGAIEERSDSDSDIADSINNLIDKMRS